MLLEHQREGTLQNRWKLRRQPMVCMLLRQTCESGGCVAHPCINNTVDVLTLSNRNCETSSHELPVDAHVSFAGPL